MTGHESNDNGIHGAVTSFRWNSMVIVEGGGSPGVF